MCYFTSYLKKVILLRNSRYVMRYPQHWIRVCVHSIWQPFWKLSENFHQKRSSLNVHFLDVYAFILGKFHYLL